MNNYQITNIEIEGFKSIQRCNLDLGMVNLLIGSNGAGKTNFISLFKMLQSMIDENLQTYIAKHGGPNAFLFFGSKQTERITVKFFFGNNGYQFVLTPTNDNRLIFEDELFYWNVTGAQSIGRGHQESVWKNGRHNGIDTCVQPILRNQKWRVYHFHDTGDTALVKQIHGLNDNEEFATDARNLAAFLYRLRETESNSYHQIVRTVQLVAPFFDDFVLRPNPLKPDSIQLEWNDKKGDIPFTASQLSDGTLRFICLATLLLQPEHLMPETILIDEPELGLHPYAVSVLASLIKKAAVEKQIIVSTQSVELLNEFEAKDVIVVGHENNHSEFERLSEEELKVWLEDDYTLGELWKKNIFGGRP